MNTSVAFLKNDPPLKISLASNTDDASQLFSLFEKEETLDVS